MKLLRPILLAAALLTLGAGAASAQTPEQRIAVPTLRADVRVTGDLVTVGDMIDNAGSAAQVAIYRAPDLGTTGKLPVAQIVSALRAHQVIGVDTHNLQEVSVTRVARTLDSDDIELFVATALEHRNGLGDASNLSVTFDRDVQTMRLDAAYSGEVKPVAVRFDSRGGRFDVTFEIASDSGANPARLRFTGTAVETVEAAVLTRGVERGEILKASDISVERRPKLEVGHDAASRDLAVGMQARRSLRGGQALRVADIAKPDLVQRDHNVILIYRTAGLYLTIRGKAMEAGTEGDVVSVLNLQSKRTVSGVVVGRDEVSVTSAEPRAEEVAAQAQPVRAAQTPASVAIATNDAPPAVRTAE